MSVSVEVRGLNEMLGRFAKLNTKLYGELYDATKKSAVVIKKRAKTYPPKRPSSRYRRTGTLGRRWHFTLFNSRQGPWAKVSNNTTYGKWVMGADDQAWMHKGRWARTDQIVEEQQRKIDGFFEYAVRQALK